MRKKTQAYYKNNSNIPPITLYVNVMRTNLLNLPNKTNTTLIQANNFYSGMSKNNVLLVFTFSLGYEIIPLNTK